MAVSLLFTFREAITRAGKICSGLTFQYCAKIRTHTQHSFAKRWMHWSTRGLVLRRDIFRYQSRPVVAAALAFSLFSVKKPSGQTMQQANPEGANQTSTENSADSEAEVIMLLKHAKLAEMMKEYEKADDYYHRALQSVALRQQHQIWSKERALQARTHIYDGMANLAIVQGRLEAAETLFKQVLQGLLQQGVPPNDTAVVEVSLKLAVIYASQQRNTEAQTGYQFCIETLESKMKTSTPDPDVSVLLGMSADAYSRFLIGQGDYTAALEYLHKALHIATRALGDDHEQIAVLMNDIAAVSSLVNDLDTAQRSLERAVAIGEQTASIHLATLYYNLAQVLDHKADYGTARKFYQLAITLAKKNQDKQTQEKAELALKAIKTPVK